MWLIGFWGCQSSHSTQQQCNQICSVIDGYKQKTNTAKCDSLSIRQWGLGILIEILTISLQCNCVRVHLRRQKSYISTTLWVWLLVDHMFPRAHVAKYYGRHRLIPTVIRTSTFPVFKIDSKCSFVGGFLHHPFCFQLVWRLFGIAFRQFAIHEYCFGKWSLMRVRYPNGAYRQILKWFIWEGRCLFLNLWRF